MTRAFFLAACLASALLSHVSGEMMEQSEQYQPGQQGQQINGQQMGGKQMSGEQMGSTQTSESKGKNGDMQGDKDGNGGGNPVIIIATNAGGSSQTQQMNAAVQPPQTTHTVTVGGPSGLIYSPDSVQAAQYDMIQFNFMSKNHTVTQSTFQQPCQKMQPMPMPAADSMPAGNPPIPPPIDSGFMPTTSDNGPFPMMLLQITSPPSTPMWFYCRQKTPTPHCGSGNGMTFSINPHQPGMGDKTQAAFKARAMMQMGNSTLAAANGGVAAAGSGVQMQQTTAVAAGATSVASGQNQAAGSMSQQQQASQSPSQSQASQPPTQQQPSPSPSPSPPLPSPPRAPMAQGTGQNQPSQPPPPPPAPMAQGTGQTGTPMALGTGQTNTNTNGACECSCLCGAAAFPNAMQGVGMMGGMPGAVPAAGGGMK